MQSNNFLKEFAAKKKGIYSYFEDFTEFFEVLDTLNGANIDTCIFTNNASALFNLMVNEARLKRFFSDIDCFVKITVTSKNNVSIVEPEGFEYKTDNKNRLVFIQDYYLLDYVEQRKLISDMVPSEDYIKVMPKPLINTNYLRQKNDNVLFVAELKENNILDVDYSIGYKMGLRYFLYIEHNP